MIPDTRKPSGILRRHGWSMAGLLLVLVVAAYFLIPRLLGPELPAWPVQRLALVQTVVASGRVETPLRVDIGSQLTGTVAELPVRQGQTVRRGQLLIALESSEQQAAVQQARAALAQAQARVLQLDRQSLPAARQNLQQAQITLRNAQRQYQRQRELREKNFVGQAALDDVRRNLDIAASQVEAARLQVEAMEAGGVERAIAQSALQQARAGLAAAEARLALTRIVAPHDGVLIARDVEQGDVVQPGRALLVLSPAGPTELVLQIDERNLAQIRLDQQALASADAYPEQRFAARVSYINPGIDAQRGSVEVRLEVPQPPEYLRQDMTVSVDIVVARKPDALVIPADTVRSGGERPWVMKVADGRARAQPVRLGLRGDGRVEVLEGLREGELVLSGTEMLAEGKRLRPRVATPAPGANPAANGKSAEMQSATPTGKPAANQSGK